MSEPAARRSQAGGRGRPGARTGRSEKTGAVSARNASHRVGFAGLGGVGGGRATWRARRARAPPTAGQSKASGPEQPRHQLRLGGLNRHPPGERDEGPDSAATILPGWAVANDGASLRRGCSPRVAVCRHLRPAAGSPPAV